MGGSSPQGPSFSHEFMGLYAPILQEQARQSARAMDLMETQWDEITRLQRKNEPIQDYVVEMAVDRMERYDKWAIADRERYDSIYAPLEDAFAKKAAEYDAPWRREQEAAKAQANAAQMFEQSRQTALDKLEKYGVDPSQTRYGALDKQSRVAEAAAQAGAGNQARDRVEQMGLALTQQAIQNGRNVVAQSMAEDQMGGQAGSSAVGTGIAGMGSYAQAAGTPGSWFGLGAQQTNAQSDTMTNMLNAEISKYKADIDKFSEEQKADKGSGFGDILGPIAGMGFRALTKGFTGGLAATGGAIPDGFGTGKWLAYDEGGDIRGGDGGFVPSELSPSGGAIPDDVDAAVSDGGGAKLNAGEFVLPRDVMEWRGQQWAQKEIMKARKEMADPAKAPAQPTPGPGDLPSGMAPPMPGAIPSPPMG